ncbi:MAG: T9SS type A sorting domain-containing protein [candidate division WOR-3 bacterium]
MFRSLIITSMWANLLFCQQGWVSLQGPEGGGMRYMLWLPPDYTNLIGCASNGEWYQLAFSEGLYYSRNSGNRWFPCENGIDWSKGGIQQLDYNYINPHILYAAQGDVSNGAVYKSTDGGLTWVNIAPVNEDFRAIYCSRKNPNILLIGSREPNVGIFRSTDGGETWVNVNPNIRCNEFAYDPRCPDTIYVAGAVDSYMWRSVDGGQTWTQIANFPVGNIVSVAVDPQDGNIIYCIPDDGTDHYGIYRSSNFGTTWQQVLAPPAWYVIFPQVRVSPANPNIVWVVGLSGLYLSTNRGLNFTRIQNFPGAGWGVLPHPARDSVAFVSSGDRLWLTTDFGNSWQVKSFRMHGLRCEANKAISGNRNIIYTLAYGAYYSAIAKTTDGGKTWHSGLERYCNLPYNVGPMLWSLDVHPENSNIVIVGASARTYKTTDGGVVWDTLFGFKGFCDVRFSQANHNHVWAAADSAGVYKSTNMGDTFVRTNAPYGQDRPYVSVAPHPADSNIVLAGTTKTSIYVPSMILRTSDGGTNWQTVYTSSGPSFYDIEFAPSSPQIAYTANGSSVYKSTDTGLTWTLAGALPAYIYDIEVDPLNADILYAGTNGSGVFVSTDGGIYWNPLNLNLRSNEVVFAVQVLYEVGNPYVYCGTTRGLYLLGSIDTIKPSLSVIQPNGGEVLWSGQNYNILWNATDNIEVDGIDIFYSTDAGTLYQGISYNELNDGIYSWTVPNTPSNQCLVRIDAYDFAGNIAWDQSDNYFSIQQTNIEENKPRAEGDVSLEIRGLGKPIIYCTTKENTDADFAIYNIIGQRLFHYFLKGFMGTRVFDLDFLPSGVYFAVLSLNNHSEIKKVVVVR